mmetsp:Transcript_111199/g.248501  ORF Transcript_111199/g.248501 Transcript_111199/m.248501 type:complete len:488 (+) Transcript_111199:434-1897(+)
MCGASVHQVVVDMHIRADVVLLAELIAKLEGLLRPLAPVRQLDNDGECEVAGPHTKPLHVRQKPVPTIPKAVARAAIEEGVVGDLIGAEARRLFHLPEKLESLVDTVLLAITLDDGAVGDDVRLDSLAMHVLQEGLDARHVLVSCASVDEGIVRHNRELDLRRNHLLIDSPYAVKTLLMAEALENRAVDHRVHQVARLPATEDLTNETVTGLGIAIGDEGFHHATNGDGRGHDVVCPHLAPHPPSPRHVLDEPEGTDDAAVRMSALHLDAPPAALPLQLFREKVAPSRADARLADRAEELLVHIVVHDAHELQGALNVPGFLLNALQEDRARDMVGTHPAIPHLLDDGPGVIGAQLDRCVDEFVEGHTVWCESRGSHHVHSGACPPQVIVPQVRLDEGVVCDDISHLRIAGLLYDALRSLDVTAVHANIEEGVVESSGLLQASLEDGKGLLQAVLGAEALQQSHVVGCLTSGVHRQQLREKLRPARS